MKFDKKTWNPSVFEKYKNMIPNVKETEMIKHGVLSNNPSLAARLVDGVGGNYIVEPIKGLLDGDVINYDGSTNITATSRTTFEQGKVVIGRAKAWQEKDFSKDITGVNWMEGIATEIAEYYEGIDQDDILSIIKGIFNMEDSAGLTFVEAHTYDVSQEAVAANRVVGAGTLNKSIQKASGSKKGAYSLAFMHSMVSTNLETLQLLNYLTFTDANGIQRDLSIATWNGRAVIVTDEVPVESDLETVGVQTLKIDTKGVNTDTITVSGVEYTFVTSGATGNEINVGTSSTTQALALKNLLAARTDLEDYLIEVTTDTITFTMLADKGVIAIITKTETGTISSTLTVTVPAVYADEYTTYVMGNGFFEFANCGAAVPSEMDRDAYTDGGIDVVITRQRKLFAPKWISFTKAVMATLSPTNAELENGSNWEIVNDGNGTYVNHKMIPIVQIISRG